VGVEEPQLHHRRFCRVLAPYALRLWPYEGMVSVQETSLTGERTDIHLLRDWCWLGSASDEGAFEALLDAPPRAAFDLDIYRLLCKWLPRLRVRAHGRQLAAQQWSDSAAEIS
jgi:DNA polymerase III subunit epsilon